MDGSEYYLTTLGTIDSLRRVEEQRRTIAALTNSGRMFDQARAFLDQERRISDELTMRRILDDMERLRNAAMHGALPVDAATARLWADHQRMLEASAKAYQDVMSMMASPSLEFLQYARLNRALVEAAFLGEVEVGDRHGDDEESNLDVEDQLIEVVPASALDALRRVEFAPFSLLATAVRRPESLLELSPRTFEQFVAELVSRLGIEDVILTPEKGDGGRDVIGTTRVLGMTLILAFECKRYRPENPVPIQYARALLGTITYGDSRADRGVLVTTSHFTAPAHRFIVTSPQLEGVDFDGIVGWLRQFSNGSSTQTS